MEEPDYKYQLACLIDDLQHDLAILVMDLDKSYDKVAPCRRARVLTVHLTKKFKEFRKVSCCAGLK